MASYGIQSENEPVTDPLQTQPSGYEPSLEEKKLVKKIMAMFDKNKKHRKKYDEKWLEYYKFFRGKQWKDKRPSYRHSEVINMVFQEIQSTVPMLTDVKPKFSFIPQEPSDLEFSEILNMLCDSDWESKNWGQVLTENLYDANIYGTSLGYMAFDPKANDGVGDVEFCSSDVFYCFPDPNAVDVNKKARNYMMAEPIDISVMKQDYPDKAKFFKPDLLDLMQGDKTELTDVRFKSPTDTRVVIDGSSTQEASSKNRTLKITAYYFDDEIEETEEDGLNPNTGMQEKVYLSKLKFPKGRKTVVCNNMILEDGPNPYEDGKFPYAKLVNYMLPREFWGISDIEQLMSPQMVFNKLISFALDVMTLMGNPIWVVGNASGIDTDNLFNEPGLVVEADDISQVKREEGVQLQPYVIQLIDRMKSWFDDISGNNDVSRGVDPGNVTAASAIQSLQEAGKTRIRLKARMLDYYLQDLGQMYVSRKLQFSTAPQVYRITNSESAQNYFKFHVEPVLDDMGQEMMDQAGNPIRKAKVVPFAKGLDGQMVEDTLQSKEMLVRGKFDVRVQTGSGLPFAKKEKADLAFKLFELQIIDAAEVLTQIDYPNKEKLLLRLQQRQQQAAMAQGQQQPPMGA